MTATGCYFAPCPRGLEETLAVELSRLGATRVAAVLGGVGFGGDLAVGYRANLESRVASRILLSLGEARYANEQDIYAFVKAIDWPAMFTVERTLRVDVSAIRSPLRSLEFATLRVKDAICDRFREKQGVRPSVDTVSPDVRVQLFLTANAMTVYLDLSGDPLFKRGWREEAGEAPLRENLAAGMVALSGWQPGTAFLDPMCGSGTIAIEAAQMTLGIAPGLGRSFGFERLRGFDAGLWKLLRDAAGERIERGRRQVAVFGSDREAGSVVAARANAARAGVDRAVQFEVVDVRRREAPAAAGILVSNPPYGVRLESRESLELFYPQLGSALKASFAGWTAYLISPEMKLPGQLGLKASKRTVLFNGAIECRLFEFRMVAGAHR
ncbi:MAG: class I SAM-dependent RNA methyltransferase [bacterium]|nr:THUMP domain-containing protein [Betaproteobacteria bacterium]